MKFTKSWIWIVFFLIGCQNTPHAEKNPPAKKAPKAKVDREGIRKTFFNHRGYIRGCYQKVLSERTNESLTGLVVVNFDIDPSGRGNNAKLNTQKTTLKAPKLHDCILTGIQSWDWPVHPEGEIISVVYPLKFDDRPPADMQKKMDQFQKMRRQ